MKTSLVAFAFLGALFSTAQASDSDLVRAEESASVELLVDGSGTGFADVRDCARCPLHLTVTSLTEFRINNRKVGLDQAKLQGGKPATVAYTQKTKQAVEISWNK